MTNHSRIGALSELKAVCWLMEQGYSVFRNVSPEGAIDIIALRGEEIRHIDVKTGDRASQRDLSYGAINKVEILYVSHSGDVRWGNDIDPWKNYNSNKICEHCSSPFIASTFEQKYCKKSCGQIYWKRFYKEKRNQQRNGAECLG